jgi:hypothetical protein
MESGTMLYHPSLRLFISAQLLSYEKINPQSFKGSITRYPKFIAFLKQLQSKIVQDRKKVKAEFKLVPVETIISSNKKLKSVSALYQKGRISSKVLLDFEKQVILAVRCSGLELEEASAIKQWEAHNLKNRKKILLLLPKFRDKLTNNEVDIEFTKKTLIDLGYVVKVIYYRKDIPTLNDYDQLWLLSAHTNRPSDPKHKLMGKPGEISERSFKSLEQFLKKQKGLYILGDNFPFYHQADLIAKRLHQAEYYHVDSSKGMISVMRHGSQPFKDKEKEAKSCIAIDHEVFSGIYQFFEGDTVSAIKPGEKLKTIAYGTSGDPILCIPHDTEQFILYDSGFTRILDKYIHDEYSTRQWIKNVAFYLEGKKRQDLIPEYKSSKP